MSNEFARGARIRPKPKPSEPKATPLPSLPLFLLTMVAIAQDDYKIKTLRDLQDMIQRAWIAKEATEAKYGPIVEPKHD